MRTNDVKERLRLKLKIIDLFNKNVKGKKSNTTSSNKNHDGKEGHWLEKQMGLSHNCNNGPDIFGFEMKNGSGNKITFGDWSASYYVFKCRSNPLGLITRDEFLTIFGKSNPLKRGRFSWSGEPCPKINSFNSYGQRLIIDRTDSIIAIYSYSEDSRPQKSQIVPKTFQAENVKIAIWDSAWMKLKVENKFNQNGWFKCIKNKEGFYTNIGFGEPITYDIWLKYVATGDIFFDSGMFQGNIRNYSQWRANNKIWDSLISEEY